MRIVHQAVLSVSVLAFSFGSLTTSAHAADQPAVDTQDKGKDSDKGKNKDKSKNKKHCDELEGTFSSVVVPACVDSPVGLCTQGVLEGDLEGDYYFVFETMAPDPTDPSKFAYTGYSVITTQNGTIYTEDTGVVDAVPPEAPGDLLTEAEISYGTKKYRKKTGTFVASGVLQFGTAEGTYDATLCKAKSKP